MSSKTTLLSKNLGKRISPELVRNIRSYIFNERADPRRDSNHFYSYLYGNEESDEKKQNHKSKPYFFANKEAFDNLEVRELEILLGGWEESWAGYNFVDENCWKWGKFGHGLLNYFIRNPLTNSEALRYIQEGVKEVVYNPEIKNKLSNILIQEEGLFRTSNSFKKIENECYRVNSFGIYKTSLEKIIDFLCDAKSDCLRDIKKSLERLLKDGKFLIASKIAQSQTHKILITGGKIIKGSWSRNVPGHSIDYLAGDSKIHCFNIEDDVLDDKGTFNAYEPVWAAIKKTLNKEGFEELDNVAFDGAVLGYLNGLASLVDLYEKNNIQYTFPIINNNGQNELFFKRGVHPFLVSKKPIPNNVNLNSNPSLYVIAGANNGGKTTYSKMTGLLTLLSQMGAPIPAEEARITPINQIYTHFPKTESVLLGNGRFVDELNRLKFILENADKYSLVILDEPCAGTSNEDSIDISMGLIHGLQKIECPTLYSTHLHEIQQRLDKNKNYTSCKNLCIETKGTTRNPTFTHKIKEGIAGKSYGDVYAKRILPINNILKNRGIN